MTWKVSARKSEHSSGAPWRTSGALLLCGLLALAAVVGGCAGLPFPGRRAGSDGAGSGGGRASGENGAAASEIERVRPDTSFALWVPEGEVPLIRVGLLHGARDASVSGRAGYTVEVYSDTVQAFSARPGETWRFGAGGGGVTGSGPGGGFHIGAGTVRVRPGGGGPLIFGGTAYRGEIELFSSGPGSLTVVNVVDLESYLRGVVPREIGSRPQDELEAVKAQAVAARTYAIASGGRRAGGGFDVFATVEDQVYAGMDGEDAVSDRAVLETAGLYMSWGGAPIHAYFHANCGGRTEARHEVWELPSVPYLRSVWDSPSEDRFDDAYCSGGKHFRWTESWDGDEIGRLVRDHLPSAASTPVRTPVGDLLDLRVTVRTPSGRVRWLEVETSTGTYRVFGDGVRRLLRRPGSGAILWSSWFDLSVTKRGGRVVRVEAKGRGYGHGVGMCQEGALEMAREGRSFSEILRHYYAGVSIERAYRQDGVEPHSD